MENIENLILVESKDQFEDPRYDKYVFEKDSGDIICAIIKESGSFVVLPEYKNYFPGNQIESPFVKPFNSLEEEIKEEIIGNKEN